MPYVDPVTLWVPEAGTAPPVSYLSSLQTNDEFLYADSGWTSITPLLTGSWTAGASPLDPAFMLIDGRVVVIEGTVTAGTAGATAWTMPVGYRPASTLRFPVWTATTANTLTITTAGVVTITNASGASSTWLGGIYYPNF